MDRDNMTVIPVLLYHSETVL